MRNWPVRLIATTTRREIADTFERAAEMALRGARAGYPGFSWRVAELAALRSHVAQLIGEHDDEVCTAETREDHNGCLCGTDDYNSAIRDVLAAIDRAADAGPA